VPWNPRNHFVVDPGKWDYFYAMDCARRVLIIDEIAALTGWVNVPTPRITPKSPTKPEGSWWCCRRLSSGWPGRLSCPSGTRRAVSCKHEDAEHDEADHGDPYMYRQASRAVPNGVQGNGESVGE
jgi:hypothetical protein